MSNAVVFAFAIQDGLTPVVGAAPFDVLARQLPRILVTRVNGDGDRGVRFFPFLGQVDGVRGFLRLREPIEPKALLAVHKQGDMRLLADALLRQDALHWRLIDGATGKVVQTLELPFDPLAPLDQLPRLEFELVSALGWTGQSGAAMQLEGEALGWWLVLKDELLRHEANLPTASPDPLRAARRCVALAPGDEAVQDLVVDFLALLLRRKQYEQAAAEIALALADHVVDVARIDRLGGLVYAAGEEREAARLVVRAALLRPDDADLVERAAAMAFRCGDDAAVRDIVGKARDRGVATTSMVAQLAASCDRQGDHETRSQLLQELIGLDDLPVPVARLVVSFLLEEEQPQLARTIVERALQKAPDQAMLHFELGRACLLTDDTARAGIAMQRAMELGLSPELHKQARRFHRLSLVPGLWSGTQRVELAIASNDLDAALLESRALVRQVGSVAEAWLMFGIVHHKRGARRRAERLLRRAIREHDECAEAHNRLGVLLLQCGRVQDGTAHLDRAHALSPDDTSTMLHLAQACAMRGDIAAAERHIDEAARLGADKRLVDAVRREIRAA